MEKLTESKKDLSFTLDMRKIPAVGLDLCFSASPRECALLAERFDVPEVKNFTATVHLKKQGKLTQMTGSFCSLVTQECVVTLEAFENTVSGDFLLLLSDEKQPDVSEEEIALTDEPTEYCPRGIIPFRDLLGEQFGLNLDPFPHKTRQPFEYREETSAPENPFSVLKGLTKGKKSV